MLSVVRGKHWNGSQPAFVIQDINGLVNLIIGDKTLQMVKDSEGNSRIVLPFSYREAGIRDIFSTRNTIEALTEIGVEEISTIKAEVREKSFFTLPGFIKFAELLDQYRMYQQIVEIMA